MRKWIIAISIIVFVVVLVVSLSVSLARWTRKTEDYFNGDPLIIESGIDNGSAKYLVYVPLDSVGNIMTANYKDGEYSFNGAASVAVVGYYGTIGEIYIPETIVINNESYEVTKMLADSHYSDYAFSGNTFITKIVLPVNLIYVGNGVCKNMTELIELKCNAPLDKMTFGEQSFMNCRSLSVLTIGGETVVGISRVNSAFFQTPVY